MEIVTEIDLTLIDWNNLSPEDFQKFSEKIKENKEIKEHKKRIINKSISVKSKSTIIDVSCNKLLNESLSREEIVKIIKLANILDWEREKLTIIPKNIDQKIAVAKRIKNKS